MTTLKLGASRAIHEGIRDLSGRVAIQETIVEPTHVPVIFLLAAKQHDEPLYMFPSQIGQLLGGQTIERGSKYFSHQSQVLEIIAENANPFLYYPVKTAGSKKAFIRLSVALTTMEPLSSNGYKDYWVTWMSGDEAYPDNNRGFGNAAPFDLTDSVRVYPILEAELEYAGEYGNEIAIQIKQITSAKAPNGIGKETLMPFSLSVIEKLPSGKQRIIKTVFGEDSIAFSLDPDAMGRLGRPLYLPLAFQNHYNIGAGSTILNYGEFNEFVIYDENVETVQGLLWNKEKDFDDELPASMLKHWRLSGTNNGIDDPSKARLLNIFTGKMFDGETSYRSFTVDKALLIGDGNVVYAEQGDSGIPELKSLKAKFNQANALVDTFVYDLKSEIESPFAVLHNHDRWDFSVVYDSGFAPQAKESLIAIAAARNDVTVLLTPHSYGEIEIVPEIETLTHEGYMRAVNNFQPLVFPRGNQDVEVKGLITNLQADREISNLKIFVDEVEAQYDTFNIDEEGFWSAQVEPSVFAVNGYGGYVRFEVDVGVVDEPDFPKVHVISTEMSYVAQPPLSPQLVIQSVWNGQPVPYTSEADEYQGPYGAIYARDINSNYNIEDYFDVLTAKFMLGNGIEENISSDFSTWRNIYATLPRAEFLKGYDHTGTVKLYMRLRDKLTGDVRIVESPVFQYSIAFPVLEPVVEITEINAGKPVLPAYTGVSASSVNVKGRITELGVDNLLNLDRVTIKVANVTVSAANLSYTLDASGTFATFETNIPRGFFPILPEADMNINVTNPTSTLPGEAYHARAVVEAGGHYKQKHLNNDQLVVTGWDEALVSDVVSLSTGWDGFVDYSDPVDGVISPDDGVILVPDIPVTAGIQNIPVTLEGSYFDYQQIVSATANINAQGTEHDLKILTNYTAGAARIEKPLLYPNFVRNAVINYKLVVKHRSGTDITLRLSKPYTVRYPTLPAPTTAVTTINGDNTVWFDETYNAPNKKLLFTGTVTGLHELRQVKSVSLSIDGIVRSDVPVIFNWQGTEWQAEVPAPYLDLVNGGSANLSLVTTFKPDNVDSTAIKTAQNYTVKKITVPTLSITQVNDSLPVEWANGQNAAHTTEIVITGFNGNTAVTIDMALMSLANASLVINGNTITAANVTWSNRVIEGLNRIIATVKTSALIFQGQPFAVDGVVSGSVLLTTNHNARPYTRPLLQFGYDISPLIGVAAVAVDSYNGNVNIDPLNSPSAVYTLQGTVTGLTPNQAVTGMTFKFQDNEITPQSYQLGIPTADVAGFLTYPYTATFVGANHLTGVDIPALVGYSDSLVNNQVVEQPNAIQDNVLTAAIGNTGWSESFAENGEVGNTTPFGYEGIITASANILNNATGGSETVDSYSELEYEVIPKRIMKLTPGTRLSQLLDPKTAVLANQDRKVIDFDLAMVRSEYESIQTISVKVGNVTIPGADVLYHVRELLKGYGNVNYQRYQVALSIPNRYLIDNGEYLEMELPIYENGEEALGLYKANVLITVVVRDNKGIDRTYTTNSTLFSRAYYAIKAVAEVISINGGNPINRWAAPDTIIPIQLRVKDLYHRAMDQSVAEYNLTVDNKVLNDAEISAPVYSAAPFYNSVSVATMTANVLLTDLVELMDVWLNSGRVAPFTGIFGFAPKLSDHTVNLTQLPKVTRNFTAVEILPAPTSVLNIESVNSGGTVILNSISVVPVEVLAVVERVHPIWGERMDDATINFSINGQVVPKADYELTLTNGVVDSNDEMEVTISIKAAHEIYARYFEEDSSLLGGIPVQGNVSITGTLTSDYGNRATLSDNLDFLAGIAVEGPEDDVTLASTSEDLTLTTEADGFMVMDLLTGEVLGEGDTVEEFVEDVVSKDEIELGFIQSNSST